MTEKVSNHRIDVSNLGSGWAAVHLVDVTDKHGTYTDIQQTGIGRYTVREAAVCEAVSWSRSDEIPLEKGLAAEITASEQVFAELEARRGIEN